MGYALPGAVQQKGRDVVDDDSWEYVVGRPLLHTCDKDSSGRLRPTSNTQYASHNLTITTNKRAMGLTVTEVKWRTVMTEEKRWSIRMR